MLASRGIGYRVGSSDERQEAKLILNSQSICFLNPDRKGRALRRHRLTCHARRLSNALT